MCDNFSIQNYANKFDALEFIHWSVYYNNYSHVPLAENGSDLQPAVIKSGHWWPYTVVT